MYESNPLRVSAVSFPCNILFYPLCLETNHIEHWNHSIICPVLPALETGDVWPSLTVFTPIGHRSWKSSFICIKLNNPELCLVAGHGFTLSPRVAVACMAKSHQLFIENQWHPVALLGILNRDDWHFLLGLGSNHPQHPRIMATSFAWTSTTHFSSDNVHIWL